MVSVEDAHSHSSALSMSHSGLSRSIGRSMRTVRSTVFTAGSNDSSHSAPNVPHNLTTDSLIDFKLNQLSATAAKGGGSPTSDASRAAEMDEFLEVSRAFSEFSACSSDISGELQLLAAVPCPGKSPDGGSVAEPSSETEPCSGFLERESFSTEIIESISPEDLQPTVKLCVDCLQSPSTAMKRSAAAKLRLLAKNRADNRLLICDSGAVPALIPLARCPDPSTQEHAVTALLNLSLHDQTRRVIARAPDSVKSLIYALKTGTDASKQNAACALLSLSLLEDYYKLSIGASGAVPPLVQLLIGGTNRGKKDALTTLYKLCSVKLNKERAVNAGVVKALVGLVEGGEVGLAEKAMVVMSSLAAVEVGREAIVEEGGVAALVEVVEDGRSSKGKEFAVMTLFEMCRESFACRGLLVREGGIPPLVALSQNGTPKAKHKAEALLAYLRESRQEASSSSSP